MKVSTEQQAPRETVLTVELDNTDVEPYLDRAYRQVVQRLNIPGFRKGKAPRKVVEQLFGRGYLLNEALDFMVQDVTSKAVEQEALELGGVPSVSIEQLDPPSFKATVPLVPSVDLGDYQAVRVAKGDVGINEEQVDNLLEQVRQEAGIWEPVDGTVELGDLINLTIRGWVEGDDDERQEVVYSEDTDYIPKAGTTFPVPGIDEALVGLPQGETKNITVDVPEDSDSHPGETVAFEVTVHSIKRRSLPDLDDEFAKGVGDGFESLEALRERIRQNLREQEERNVDAKHQDEVMAKVVQGATVEISQLIVDHELEHFMEEREERLKSGRLTFQEYQEVLASAGKSPEEVHEEARSKAEDRLKRAHVLREVIAQQQMTVTDEELDAEVEVIAADAATEADAIRGLFAEEDRRDSLRRMLLNRKALAYLTAIAVGEPTPQELAAPAAEPSSKTEEAAEAPAEADQEEAGGN